MTPCLCICFLCGLLELGGAAGHFLLCHAVNPKFLKGRKWCFLLAPHARRESGRACSQYWLLPLKGKGCPVKEVGRLKQRVLGRKAWWMPGPKPTPGKASLRRVWSNPVLMSSTRWVGKMRWQARSLDCGAACVELVTAWRCYPCSTPNLLVLSVKAWIAWVFFIICQERQETELPAVQEGSLTIRHKKVNVRMDNA